jgi:hypothetical protein
VIPEKRDRAQAHLDLWSVPHVRCRLSLRSASGKTRHGRYLGGWGRATIRTPQPSGGTSPGLAPRTRPLDCSISGRYDMSRFLTGSLSETCPLGAVAPGGRFPFVRVPMVQHARRRRASKPTNWPCVFSHPFLREQVDPRVQKQWKEHYHQTAPFGDLRRQWREQHCRTLNPYGSEGCPYRPQDCAIAFYRAVAHVCRESSTNPRGLFRIIARNSALDRADTKLLARDRVRTDVLARPGDDRADGLPSDEGRTMSRSAARPVHIRDVLRSLDGRSRELDDHEGKESPI